MEKKEDLIAFHGMEMPTADRVDGIPWTQTADWTSHTDVHEHVSYFSLASSLKYDYLDKMEDESGR